MPRIKGASFQGGCYLYVDYSYSQSVSLNRSTVSYTFGIHFGDYYFNATNKVVSFSASPGSASHSWTETGTRAWPHGGTNRDYAYHSGSFTVNHDVYGRATVSVSGRFSPSSAGGGGTRYVSGSFALTQIPRHSTPPSVVSLSNITSTSVHATFSDGTGGAPIDSRQIGYGTSTTTVQHSVASDRSTTITGLAPGTTYYFWARTHNAAGWTAWGPRGSATTLRVPTAPYVTAFTSKTMTSLVVEFIPQSNGGAAITGYQIGYGTVIDAPTTIVSAISPQLIENLEPGTNYYFWVRAQNSVGWSEWRGVYGTATLAGARILVGTEWKTAVPYVKDGGVWKIAQPWVRSAGIWRKTT